jgi:hypothetical protein
MNARLARHDFTADRLTREARAHFEDAQRHEAVRRRWGRLLRGLERRAARRSAPDSPWQS